MKKKWAFLTVVTAVTMIFVSIILISYTWLVPAHIVSSHIRLNNPYPDNILPALENILNHELNRGKLIQRLSHAENVDYYFFNIIPQMELLRLDLRLVNTTKEVAESIPSEIVDELNKLPMIKTYFEKGKLELENSYHTNTKYLTASIKSKSNFQIFDNLVISEVSNYAALENRFIYIKNKQNLLELIYVEAINKPKKNQFFSADIYFIVSHSINYICEINR